MLNTHPLLPKIPVFGVLHTFPKITQDLHLSLVLSDLEFTKIFYSEHPSLFIFSDLFLDKTPQKLYFDDLFAFLLHNMFRPSGPDHVLIITGRF